MRAPTPRNALYAWHRDALVGKAVIVNDEPHCGWFKCRLVKGGVMVPARVWMFQEIDAETGELVADEVMQCEINGAFANPVSAWSRICGHPITEHEFRYLTALIFHAIEHEPDLPHASPRQPVDWLTVPIPFQRKDQEDQ